MSNQQAVKTEFAIPFSDIRKGSKAQISGPARPYILHEKKRRAFVPQRDQLPNRGRDRADDLALVWQQALDVYTC